MSVLDAALAALGAGLSCFPVDPETKKPLLREWKPYQEHPPAKRNWEVWAQAHPGCGLGLVTGSVSGIVVVDVDDPFLFDAAVEQFGETDRVVKTPRGFHLYYRHPGERVRGTVGLGGQKLDLRGDGNYVVAPPSEGYSLERDGRIADLPPFRTPAPSDSEDLRPCVARLSSIFDVKVPEVIPEGQRNHCLFTIGAAMRARGESREAIEAELFDVNAKRCRPPLGADEVLAIVASASRYEPNEEKGETEIRTPGDEQKKGQDEARNSRAARLTVLSDIEPEEVEWLMHPYLAIKKSTIVGGMGDVGKTTLLLDWIARLTRGMALPSGDQHAPASAIYASAEDGTADTLLKRAASAGADLSRIGVLEGYGEKNAQVQLADLDVIEEAVQKIRPVLVVFDPLSGFLGAGTDMWRPNETRPLMEGVQRLAEKYHFAVVYVSHFKKGEESASIHRLIGSVDIVNFARSVLVAGPWPQDSSTERALVHAKSNLAAKGPSLAYELVTEGVPPKTSVRVDWKGEADVTIDQLAKARREKTASKTELAERLLEAELASGMPKEAAPILDKAKVEGISASTLSRARKALGVNTTKPDLVSGWLWSLPKDAAYQ